MIVWESDDKSNPGCHVYVQYASGIFKMTATKGDQTKVAGFTTSNGPVFGTTSYGGHAWGIEESDSHQIHELAAELSNMLK